MTLRRRARSAAIVGLALSSSVAPAVALQDDVVPAHPDDVAVPPLPLYTPAVPQASALACGAALFVLEDRAQPVVDGALRFAAGSAREPASAAGLATVLADALRAGGGGETPGAELDRWLADRGASITASAHPDYVEVRFSCLAADTDGVLAHVASLVLEPSYPEPVVERAKRRLATETERLWDDPAALADRATLLVAYGVDSPFARIPDEASIGTIDRDGLVAFHRAHFGADRLVIGVAGDVSEETLRERWDELLAELGPVGPAPVVPAPAFIQPSQTRIHLVDRPDGTRTELRIAAPGTRRIDPDYAHLALWSEVMGANDAASRLVRGLRTELGLTYRCGASYEPEWARSGRFVASCAPRPEVVDQALEAMIDVLRGGLEPLSTDELEAGRGRLASRELLASDEPLEVLERQLDLAFYGYPADFRARSWSRLRKSTADDLAGAVGRHLAADRWIVVAVGPVDDIGPRLERFGDLSPFEPHRAAPPAPPGLDATTWLGRMFEALGGRDSWASLEAIETEITVVLESGQEVPTRQWQDLGETRFRADYSLGGVTTTIAIDGDFGWQGRPNGTTPLPAQEVARQSETKRRGIWDVLHRLAKDQLDIELQPNGGLVVTGPRGLKLILHLDADHRPRELHYAVAGEHAIRVYSDWKDQDGLWYAARIREERTKTEWRITRFAVLAEFDEALVRR